MQFQLVLDFQHVNVTAVISFLLEQHIAPITVNTDSSLCYSYRGNSSFEICESCFSVAVLAGNTCFGGAVALCCHYIAVIYNGI